MSSTQDQARNSTENDRKKTKEKWLCDICKEVSFDTFEEAALHEVGCSAAAVAVAATETVGATAAAANTNASASPAIDITSTRSSTHVKAENNENRHVSENVAVGITTKRPTRSPPEAEAEAISSTCTSSEVEQTNTKAESKSKGAQKVVYLCDFCQVAQFESYDKACQHEDSCSLRLRQRSTDADSQDLNGGRSSATTSRSSSSSSASTCSDTTGTGTPNPKALAAIFTSSRPKYTPSSTNAVRSNTTIGRSITTTASTAGTVGTSSSKGGATERKLGAYTNGYNGSKKASPGTALFREHKAAEASARFAAERKRKRDDERERKRKREAVAAAAAAAGKRSSGAADSTCNVVGIFARQPKKSPGPTSVDTGVVDLVGADFAKSPSVSRGRKRVVATTAGTLALGTAEKESLTTDEIMQLAFPLAPRFPAPTHLIGGDDSTMTGMQSTFGGKGTNGSCPTVPESGVFVSSEQLDFAANYLITSARHRQASASGGADGCVGPGDSANQRQGKIDCSPKELPLTCTPDRMLSTCTSTTTTMQGDMHADENLARTIASVMSPPPITIGDDTEPSNELWSAKHGICHVPNDICGETNKESAKKLMTFIGEWKAHRAEFVKKIEEKRKSIGSRKRRMTKKGGSGRKYYKDDLWCDTDDEELGLCNIFLLNGPHGTGKSALVHAAARQTGCVLLEINTTEKRGGSALKRAIEECTQSHSSLALLKRGGPTTAMGDLGAALVANGDTDLGDLCGGAESDYSDFEDNDEDHGDDDAVDRGRLAIILIDEVDNIFENDGDSGFWVALASLSKKAKCPIVLTSGITPMLLEASSIRYQATSLCRPSPDECASTIRRIALEEEVLTSGREDDGGNDRDALRHIAELCSCDLRSILNAMQLHCHGSLSLSAAKAEAGKRNRREVEEEGPGDASPMTSCFLDCPEILNITPSTVDGGCHSVLTIRGRNFVGTNEWDRIHVLIGGRPSPMLRVVDDETILAVSPPCNLLSGVDSSGIFEMTFEPCITSRHLAIDVMGMTRTGLVAHSDSALVCAPGKHWNVAYSFPEPSDRLEDLCNKREEARGSKRHKEAFSSDEEDFVIPTSTRTLLQANEEKAVGGVGQLTLTSVVSMASENDDLSPDHNVDLAALLEKASNDLVRQDQEDTSKLNHEQCSLKCDRLGGTTEVKNADSKHYGDEKVALELEELVRELENSSDASFLQESLHSMVKPTLSGSTKGFAFDFVDQQSSACCFKSSSTTSIPKKLRNTAAKPPSIEKIFASGWNESSFFFGATEEYLTLPSTRAERSEISRALAHPLSDRCAVGSSLAKNNDPEDSTSMNSSSLLSSSGLAVSEDGFDDIAATYDSDSFVRPELCKPIYALPSLLRGTLEYPFRNHLALLTIRKTEKAMLLLSVSSILFQDVGMASSFCSGLGDFSDVKPSGMLDDLDLRMSLDYLPFLRAMAVEENNADKRYHEKMEEVNVGALGMLQVGNIVRRSTRRAAKAGREHYFNRMISGQGVQYEEARTRARQISDKLSNEILHY